MPAPKVSVLERFDFILFLDVPKVFTIRNMSAPFAEHSRYRTEE